MQNLEVKKTTKTKHQSNMWWVSMEVNHWRQLLPENQILFFTTKTGQFRNAIRELKEQNSHIQLTTEYTIWIRDIIGRVVVHTWRCLGGYCCTLWAASQSCLSAESPSGRERREMKRRWREKGGDPLSDRDRRSREKERERKRRGLGGTEVGVVTEWVNVCVCVRVYLCVRVCVGEQVVLQWKQYEEDCSFWCWWESSRGTLVRHRNIKPKCLSLVNGPVRFGEHGYGITTVPVRLHFNS